LRDKPGPTGKLIMGDVGNLSGGDQYRVEVDELRAGYGLSFPHLDIEGHALVAVGLRADGKQQPVAGGLVYFGGNWQEHESGVPRFSVPHGEVTLAGALPCCKCFMSSFSA
jgi:hypothetical protein